MLVKHSPPAKNTRSQRNPAVLTPTERVPLDCTQSVNKLSENFNRGPPMEGAAPFRKGGMKSRRSRLGEVEDEEGQPIVSQTEPSLLKMMEKMTQFMGKLNQDVAPRDNPKTPAFKTPSMKAPDSFDGTQVHKLRGFIQSCQLIFHNYPGNFFSDRNKVLYSTSFLTSRAGKWIEPYISNISNEDPSYLLGNWKSFETQLFTLFGDPNEVRKAEK
ncbi:hypothetical protein O181_057839 [Austropuccinia psidii MF-1]|uniref:DUF4939 domain-containing protein n=1 Tax=Austropuccinia psidii MF-1 TaxID=1389203 RepID=A0A9Q3HX22_9BASI|nr:hypothetical protein [Austropuccinia psidii MF-1]